MDGHGRDANEQICKRCLENWPCPAEQQWEDIRTTLVQAAATELIAAQEKRMNAQERT